AGRDEVDLDRDSQRAPVETAQLAVEPDALHLAARRAEQDAADDLEAAALGHPVGRWVVGSESGRGDGECQCDQERAHALNPTAAMSGTCKNLSLRSRSADDHAAAVN